MDVAKVKGACVQYPKPAELKPSYGTAGFRSNATLLPCTVFRCGLLMALRAMHTGKVTGMVITASHNPEEDNGVKLVEPSGHMLCQEWEELADDIANTDDAEAVVAFCKQTAQRQGFSIGAAEVMIAHDTRPSAVALVAAAGDGISCLGATARACGLLTTPQLHWMVRQGNRELPQGKGHYLTELADAFAQLSSSSGAPAQELVVDCANGVGAAALQELEPRLQGRLQLRLCNTDVQNTAQLNAGCGADYVQKERTCPSGVSTSQASSRCASIDGDADRLVYFRQAQQQFELLDGDRIAALLALLVQHLAQGAGLAHCKLGVIQTAYANGASTAFLSSLDACSVHCTPTGVKYLHPAAEQYDLGIYFEANGHGTVLFSDPFLEKVHQAASQSSTATAAAQMLALSRLANQAVGDAMSGILMVEAALGILKLDLQSWSSLYTDLPSKQLKVKVSDRTVIQTADAERRAVKPEGLQAGLDAAAQSTPSGRVFVRPSGTEDVVRVYAEASAQMQADALALQAAKLLHELAGGMGPAPG